MAERRTDTLNGIGGATVVRRAAVAALCVYTTIGWASPVEAQSNGHAKAAVQEFSDRVQAYVALQRDLERSSPEQKSTTDVTQIENHQRVLAMRIAAARQDVRQGDIFTPSVTKHLRGVIGKAFRGSDGRNMRRTIREGDPSVPTVLRVNDVYPEESPLTTMPPMLLRTLPILPPTLAYRIVARALVLKDVKTNVIVDILPAAIPSAR